MSLISSMAVFFIMWWVVLFGVLPWGVRGHHEANTVEPGTVESAPVAPRIGLKFAITTAITAVLFTCLYVTITYELISLEDLFPMPNFR